MEKVSEFDKPAPAPGLKTTNDARPINATSEAGICTVRWLASTTVVERPLPFHLSTLPEPKLDPVTFNVNAGAPGSAWLGESEAMLGWNDGAP
jgi:hypothetical protein